MQKVYNLKVGDYRIIDITNLAGKTQYLTVTVINPDTSVPMFMLDFKSNIVPLTNSLVLRKDTEGLDKGTFIFAHSIKSDKIFTTNVVFNDASKKTMDTITFNINDLPPPPKKHLISILQENPLIVPVSLSPVTAIGLTVKNLTPDKFSVWVPQPRLSSHFHLLQTTFDVDGSPGANTTTYTINYERLDAKFPDSEVFVFTPTVENAAGETVKIIMIDTGKYIELPMRTKYFYDVAPGTTNCDTIIISNDNGIPATITSFAFSGKDAASFKLNSAPSLPLTIADKSTLALSYCYVAPDSRGIFSYAELLATFHTDISSDQIGGMSLYGSTKSCLDITPDSLQFGDLIAGGTAEGSVNITNTFDHAITITGDSWSDFNQGEIFSLIGTTFPFQLASKEMRTLKFRFAPTADARSWCFGIDTIKYTGSGDANCTWLRLVLEGRAVDPADTGAFQLFPNIKSAMPIESDQQTTSKDFFFICNTSHNVKVISVAVKDGTHFAVASPTSSDLPITLQPFGRMKVTITFDASTNGFYDDELDIVTENGLTSQAFSLQGMRTNGISAGVKTSNAVQPQIMLSPNPSHGPVAIAISDANVHFIDIYDLLGNLVASEKNSNLWVWDGKTMNDETGSDGTYFIRASGVTTSGAPFVKTTKLVRR
jgi:hypothetical protein